MAQMSLEGLNWGEGGVLSSPSPNMSVPDMIGQGRYVNPWPIHPTHPSTHPPTHPPIPPNHPSINPLTHYPFPNPPLGPNNPSGSTPPPTRPTDLPTHTPTHPPTHPCALSIMPNEFTYYSSTSFQDSKLMRVIWQYPNYGIPNLG